MNIDELWDKYSVDGQALDDGSYHRRSVMTKDIFTQAIAEIISSPVEPEVILQVADFVKKQYKDAWDKMGSTGADGYWETATKDEIFEFGRFRATEDIQDYIKEKSNLSK